MGRLEAFCISENVAAGMPIKEAWGAANLPSLTWTEGGPLQLTV